MRTLSMEGTLLLALTIAFGVGCRSSGVAEAPAPPGAPLENTYWKLLDVDGRPACVAENSDEPYLQLDPAQKRAHGATGCNTFIGPYEVRGDSLRFGPLASTRRASSDPEVNRQESAFLHSLGATHTRQVTDDTLVLIGETGQVLRFAAQHSRQARDAAPATRPPERGDDRTPGG